MRPYLLLTPGPLTTSETVKEAMMSDWCTWDEDYNIGIVEVIRKELVELASSRPEEYTAVLMQGSGSFCVEATLGSVIRPEDHLLVAANGAYGKRMGVIADYYHLNYHLMKFEVRGNPAGRPGTSRCLSERTSRSDTRICSALRNHHRCAQSVRSDSRSGKTPR